MAASDTLPTIGYYHFVSPAITYQQTTLLSVSTKLGFSALYVSFSNPTLSSASFDYFASWQTGGVVNITSQQPPFTACIAVVASPHTHCDYTVLVAAFDSTQLQTTSVPRSELAATSVTASGEYR